MKRFKYVAACAVGVGLSFLLRLDADAARLQQYGQERYGHGYMDGQTALRQEAVSLAHGRWVWSPDPLIKAAFEWIPSRKFHDPSYEDQGYGGGHQP